MKVKDTRTIKILNVIFLIVMPIVVAIICLGIGRYHLSFGDVIKLIMTYAKEGKGAINPSEYSVVFSVRLPRILLAILCGAGLSTSGAAFQALFANPLVTPDTLGVASGACFGAALAIITTDANMMWIQTVALIVGILAIVLTNSLSKKNGQSSAIMIILSGMVVSSLFQALLSLVKYVADPEQDLPSITYWLMGSLSGTSYKALALGAPFIIIGLIVLYLLKWRMNILSLNEDEARAMGINLKFLKGIVIVASAMITAACVSMCGQVGWVGLLIPHTVRMIYGSNNQKVIPACISVGAIFMLIIDTVARAASAAEIPVSILTAIIGAPVFIGLLKKTGGKWL
jgi:iron complex transport system permease protein